MATSRRAIRTASAPEAVTPCRAARILAVVLGVACAAAFLVFGGVILLEPYVLNYGEGLNLWAANQIRTGEPLYVDPFEPPYLYYPYPPVFPGVAAGLIAILGVNLFALRLLVLVAEIVLAGLVFRILRRCEVSRDTALLAAGLLLGFFAFHRFHVLARVDFLQLVFTFSALHELLAWPRDRRPWRLAVAAVALVLSALTKPTALLMIGAVGLHGLLLALRAGSRRTGVFVFATAAVSLAGYGACVLILDATTGGAFTRNTWILIQASGYFSGFSQVVFFLAHYGVLAAMGILGILFVRRHGLIRLMAGVSLVWYVYASHKKGADQNYNLETLVLLTITAALLLERLRTKVSARLWPGGPRTAAWLPPLAGVILLALPALRGPAHPEARSAAARAERAKLDALAREAPGPLLTEEPFFAVHNRKPLWMSDPYQYTMLARHDPPLFDCRPLLEAIEQGRFGLILISFRLLNGFPYRPDLPPPRPGYTITLEAIKKRYRVVYQTEHGLMGCPWWAYAPRDPPGPVARRP